MNSKELKYQRRHLLEESKKWPREMTQVPPEQWQKSIQEERRFMVWRSREYLAQGFREDGDVVRLSLCRTALDTDGHWKDGISWESLQRIKAECGYGDRIAFEIYPRDQDVVNVANLRHLWLPPSPPGFGWTSI